MDLAKFVALLQKKALVFARADTLGDARWCAGLDHAMSEGSSYPVWETLPAERQHGLVRSLPT
jgi:hypothetical protein